MSKPKPLTSKSETMRATALRQMVLALRQNRPADAANMALRILGTDPLNLLARQSLAQAQLAQGHAEAVVEGLCEAVHRFRDPGLDSLYSRALVMMGREVEAIVHLSKVTERPPPVAQLFLELADLQFQTGHVADGIVTLERGLSRAPADPLLTIGSGYFHLRQGNRREARKLFEAAHSRAPQRHDGLVALGTVMMQDGDFDAAVDLFRQALSVRPNDVMSEINLGRCLLETGQRPSGEAVLRAAAQRSPEVAAMAISSLSQAAHGRFFLRPSAAMTFLGLAGSD